METRTVPARPSFASSLVNWLLTAFAVGFLLLMIYLMWPMIMERVTGAAVTPPAPFSAPTSPPAARLPVYSPAAPAPALPVRNPGGSYNNPADADAAYAAAVQQADVSTPTATSAPCELITWADGSQGCDDGRAISIEQSQPGYCTPVVWSDNTISCSDGKPSGKVQWIDPEAETPTPWPAAPTDSVQWTAIDGPSGNTCVTVTFADAHTQTACSDPNVKLDSDDAGFVARMIEDGKIAPGVNAPKG